MALVSLEEPTPQSGFAIFNLGFRPFFLGAGFFGAFTMLIWVWSYWSGQSLFPNVLGSSLWHAHEMLFGYSTAVIAGFLLTAAGNWTKQPMPHQRPLALLFACWLLARLFILLPVIPLWLTALVDISFNWWLFTALAIPILKVKQSRQYPILGKLVFMAVCNMLFYSEALGLTQGTASGALYLTFFVIIGLILMMCRRLIPFFIERGVGESTALKNARSLDLASMVVFIAFMLIEVFTNQPLFSALLAAAVFIILAIRGVWWYHPGIWQRPLLWSLWVAYWMITLGMLAYALTPITVITPLLALHTIAIGGLGLITLSMMSRVSLGHTGRNVHQPPAVVSIIFIALLLAVALRVGGALLFPENYAYLVVFSGLAWAAGMIIYALRYAPILFKKRIDNKYG